MAEIPTNSLTLVLIIFIIILYYIFRRYTIVNYWRTRKVPCEPPYPLLGCIPNILASSVPEYFDMLYRKYDGHPCFVVHLLETPCLILKSPELIKSVLVKNFSKFADRAFTIDEKADPLASRSIFAIRNPEWKGLRGKLTPCFTLAKMKLMFPLMKKSGETMLEYLKERDGEAVDVKEVLLKFNCDATSSCTFGLETNCFEDNDAELVTYAKKLMKTSLLRKLGILGYFLTPQIVKILKYSFFDRDTTLYVHKLFSDIFRNRENNQNKRNDLIDVLIELKNQNSSDVRFGKYVVFIIVPSFKILIEDAKTISAQAMTLFVAGYEVISTTIALVLYEIAMNIEIQEKLRREIYAVMQTHRDLTYEALNDMQYLHNVMCGKFPGTKIVKHDQFRSIILESLRKYTHGIFLIRECLEDCYLEPYNIKVDAGMSVLIPSMSIHKDPKFYENPNQFNPDRFSVENKSNLIPYTFLAFGDGPRNCIGQRFAMLQGKVAIAWIVKNCEILKSASTPDPLKINLS